MTDLRESDTPATELDALRSVCDTLAPFDTRARRRMLEWMVAREMELPAASLALMATRGYMPAAHAAILEVWDGITAAEKDATNIEHLYKAETAIKRALDALGLPYVMGAEG